MEEAAKKDLLKSFLKSDLHKMLEEYDMQDPTLDENLEDEEKTKNLEDFRNYVKRKLTLEEIENYVERDQHLANVTGIGNGRPSNMSFCVGMVASIQQEVNWAVHNILEELESEDLSSFEKDEYLEYWSNQLNENFSRFNNAAKRYEQRKKELLERGMDEGTYRNVIKTSEDCRNYYGSVSTSIKKGSYVKHDMENFKNQFSDVSNVLEVEINKLMNRNEDVEYFAEFPQTIRRVVDMQIQVNGRAIIKFNFGLIKDDTRSLIQISEECSDEKEFTTNISALSMIIDQIDVDSISTRLMNKPQPGSINALQELLEENYKGYNPKIVTNLRKIKEVRKLWPIHRDERQGLRLVEEICGSFPIKDYRKCWHNIIDLYVESISLLRDLLNS